ncbi:MAG: hypothetical protein WCG26_12885 [Chloroflexales bacterium]
MAEVTLELVLAQARQLSLDDQARLTAMLARERAFRLAAILDVWAADASGYDEAAWPELKAALEETRRQAGAERLFAA